MRCREVNIIKSINIAIVMKNIFLIFGLIGIVSMQFQSARAQYVTIPDSNFLNVLQTHYPGCVVGNQLDTTSLCVTTLTSMTLNYSSIIDLTGIQYFDSLQALYCDYNPITWLPPLPAGLLELEVH